MAVPEYNRKLTGGPQPMLWPPWIHVARTAIFVELRGHLQDIGRLRPLRPLHDIELDVFPFLQGLEPFPLERRVVHKDIFPILEPDKSKPLAIVKPLHSAFAPHALLLSSPRGWPPIPPSYKPDKKIPQKELSSCGSCNTVTIRMCILKR
jgi:hypothetical protein